MTNVSKSKLFDEKLSSSRLLQTIVVLAAISGAFALLVEFVPLKSIPILREYVAIILPLIAPDKAVSASSHPSSSSVYFSFAWTMIPPFFACYWKWAKSRYGQDNGLLFIAKEQFGWGKRLLLIGLTPIWVLLLIAGWYGFNGGDSRIFQFGSALWVLILAGWLIPLAFAACIFLIVATFKKIIFGQI